MSIYFGVSLLNAGRCLVVPLDSRMSNKQTSQELWLCCRKWQLAGFLHAECLGVYSDCWWRAPGNKREGPYSGLLTPRPAILVLPQTVHSILLKTSFWIHLLVGKDPAFGFRGGEGKVQRRPPVLYRDLLLQCYLSTPTFENPEPLWFLKAGQLPPVLPDLLTSTVSFVSSFLLC